MKTASIDWKDDVDYSAGIREKEREDRREKESMPG